MSNPQPNFKPSAATVSILKLFGDAKPGDVVSYLAMRDAIRFPIDEDRLRSAIQSALNTSRRDDGKVFSCVPKVGYQLLRSDEVVAASDRDVRRIKRASSKAIDKLRTVNSDELDDATRGKMTTRLVTLAVASGCFDVQRTRQLEGPRASAGDQKAVKDGLRKLLFGE